MKYRKKPVVIEAVQFTGTEKDLTDILALCRGDKTAQVIRFEQGCVFIPTLEGLMRGEVGDWIIRGVKGEIYPCKPDIFEATYDKAE